MAALDVARRRSTLILIQSTSRQARRAFGGSGSGRGSVVSAAPSPAPPSPRPRAPRPSLGRELRGWLRYMSPFSRYSATFYRTDSGIADRVVELALQQQQGAAAGAARSSSSSSDGGSGGRSGAVLVDLGCGDGQIMRAALRAARSGRFAVRRVVGHELCAQLADEARRRCAAEQGGEARGAPAAASATAPAPPLPPPLPVEVEVQVVEGDAGDADLSEANAVFLYMSARANAQLLGPGPAGAAAAAAAARSARTLRPGAVVASVGFPVEGWDAWRVAERAVGSGGGSVPVYVYVSGGGGRRAGGGGGSVG